MYPLVKCVEFCALLASWGYDPQAIQLRRAYEPPPIVEASLRPNDGCKENFNRNPLVASGCRPVAEPKDYLWQKRKDGSGYFIPQYRAKHTYWGDPQVRLPVQSHVLPQVSVVQPKRVGKVRPSRSGNGNAAGKTERSKPIGEQIAEQLARQGMQYGPQMGGAYAGAAIGTVVLPGIGTVVGGIIGAWIGCGVPKYEFIRADWATKERWDLHPEKDHGNVVYATKMCSPAGFFFRFQEEQEPLRKIAALSGGLAAPFIGDLVGPWFNLVGQLGPVSPAVADNLKFVAKGFKGMGTDAKTDKSAHQKPRHKNLAAAITP